jgi:threonylcarbamoyladenosine tRNA methylthiotransferase MtaB
MPDVVRVRISSIEPTTIPDELIDHMAASRKMCRHLHVPIQSGDDGVLAAMNRRYTAADFSRFVERAAAKIPDVAIGTDVMVGFPGESADAFDRTVQLIGTLPLAYLHVFSYSKRPGTAAARLRDGIPAGVIRERSRALAELSRAKRLAFYRQHDGRTMRALFERGMADGYRTGLTDNFIRVGVRHTDDLAGRVLPVTIGGVMDGLAVGVLSEG